MLIKSILCTILSLSFLSCFDSFLHFSGVQMPHRLQLPNDIKSGFLFFFLNITVGRTEKMITLPKTPQHSFKMSLFNSNSIWDKPLTLQCITDGKNTGCYCFPSLILLFSAPSPSLPPSISAGAALWNRWWGQEWPPNSRRESAGGEKKNDKIARWGTHISRQRSREGADVCKKMETTLSSFQIIVGGLRSRSSLLGVRTSEAERRPRWATMNIL